MKGLFCTSLYIIPCHVLCTKDRTFAAVISLEEKEEEVEKEKEGLKVLDISTCTTEAAEAAAAVPKWELALERRTCSTSLRGEESGSHRMEWVHI